MKRIGIFWLVGALAAMALVSGCDTTVFDPNPSVSDEPAPRTPTLVNDKAAVEGRPVVMIETSMGAIKAELWSDAAPVTVANFLAYVDARHFDGLIFHRVMKGFMIQGGGFDKALIEKSSGAPIRNEASGDKKHNRGTLGMARTDVIDSATSEFFINLVNNDFLNHVDKTFEGFGYCAFGKVIEGMDVVDKIGSVPVAPSAGHKHVPKTPVIIKTVRRVE